MQSNALHELYRLEREVKATGDPAILNDWRCLQSSDHFYYMSTKQMADGDVHRYFSPYDSPYDSYINFMNVLDNCGCASGPASASASRISASNLVPTNLRRHASHGLQARADARSNRRRASVGARRVRYCFPRLAGSAPQTTCRGLETGRPKCRYTRCIRPYAHAAHAVWGLGRIGSTGQE